MARTPKVVEDRREQIIDAAMRVFAQKGFSRATNKDIAREAGITPGLIYHYFENKEAVFQAIVEGRSPLPLLRTLPAQVLAQPPETFLRFVIREVLAIIENEKFVQLIRMVLPEVIHHPSVSPIPIGVLAQAVDVLRHYFVSKMESGELRQADPVLATQTLVSCLMGFVLRRQILQDPSVLSYSHEQIADAIVEMVLIGLRPH